MKEDGGAVYEATYSMYIGFPDGRFAGGLWSGAAGSGESEPADNQSEAEAQPADGDGSVLIAYFSWAQNAETDEDVDAVTSPSVVAPEMCSGWQAGCRRVQAAMLHHTGDAAVSFGLG